MRKLFFLAGCYLFSLHTQAQSIPIVPVENLNIFSGVDTVKAPYEIFSPYQGVGPVVIYNTAQVDFIARDRIHLQPGFQASNFTGNGYFHGQVAVVPDFDVVFIEPNQPYPAVGQFEKLEMGLQLPTPLDIAVNTFLANPNAGVNPFDPDQISIEAHFLQGNQDIRVYGFYFQDYQRDPAALQPFIPDQGPGAIANWLEVPTLYNWRIRFAPPTTGQWNCRIEIHLNNSLMPNYKVENILFDCVSSSNQGWLTKGNDDWHLAYSGSGNSFFALGQNIGWPDNDNNGNSCFIGGQNSATFNRLFHGGYLDILDWISNLKTNGGNMVRICNVGWSYELEYNRLNNYSDRLNRGWELDQVFTLCESEDMKISMSMHDKRFKEEAGSPFSWYDNPYNTSIPGLDQQVEFFTDPTAKAIFKKKLRYFVARWGYSSSLGLLSLIGETTNDWTPDHQVITDWNHEMFVELAHDMSYRSLLTTSSYGEITLPDANDPTPFDLMECSVTSVHSYHDERSSNHVRFSEEFNFARKSTHHRWEDKPTYFEEMGNTERVRGFDSAVDGNDLTGCDDVDYHNSLWATSFMGGFGTGFVWWQWFNNDFRNANYPALNAFYSNIDFQNTSFKVPEFWDNADVFGPSIIETYYIKDEDKDRVMGWVHNSTNWWGNISQNCPDRQGDLPNIGLSSFEDDSYNAPVALPNQQQFRLQGLNNSSTYFLNYYDTRGVGGITATVTLQSDVFGFLDPVYPGPDPDYAYKAYRSGNNFRVSNNEVNDTLACDEDTVYAQGNHYNDTLGLLDYHWDFGNGQISNDRNAIAVFAHPGTYQVVLIVSDSLGWADTLRQLVVKPECNQQRLALPESSSSTWSIFPNPASSDVTIVFDSSWIGEVSMELYTIDMQLVMSSQFNSQEGNNLSIGCLPAGMYMVRVKNDELLEVKRLIITR